jgi:hypothetical protein
MNEKLKELSLQAGGSHYPVVNPALQEAFARLIIDECIDAVKNTNKHHAYTTFDLGMVEATIEKSVLAIQQRFTNE